MRVLLDLLILDVGSDGDRRQIVVAQFAGVGVVPRDVGRLARLAIGAIGDLPDRLQRDRFAAAGNGA
jgi:hypothetical protein